MANNLTAFDPAIFSKRVVENLDRMNVARQLVSTDYIGDLQENSTVKIRTLGNITISAYTGGDITIQDLGPALESFTVSDAQAWGFRVSDIEVAQTDMNTIDLYAKRGAVAMNNKVEDKIFSQYTKVHTDNKITGASSAALTLSSANILDVIMDARERLSLKDVPRDERYLAVDPKTYSLILKLDDFRHATASGDRVIATGEVGSVAGFRVFETNALAVASGAKYIMYGQFGAIQYAGQIMKTELVRPPLSFDYVLKGLLLHDATILAEDSKRIGTIKATV